MATQTVVITGPGGIASPSVKLFAETDGATVVATQAAAPGAADPSLFSAAFTDIPAGRYRVVLFSGSTPVATAFVVLSLATATFEAGSKSEVNGYASGEAPIKPDTEYRWTASDDGETHDVTIATI